MRFLLLIAALLLSSAVLGFVLNRFALHRIGSAPLRITALAISRAAFYAPALVEVGHGVRLPFPFLLALQGAHREFGVALDPFVFMLPAVVAVASLATDAYRHVTMSAKSADRRP